MFRICYWLGFFFCSEHHYLPFLLILFSITYSKEVLLRGKRNRGLSIKQQHIRICSHFFSPGKNRVILPMFSYNNAIQKLCFYHNVEVRETKILPEEKSSTSLPLISPSPHLVMYWISAFCLNHSRTLAPSSISCTYTSSQTTWIL